uniref:Uncharacterized protein n=1 Tax=Tetraselmis sp. GSL018 TaxID=582737 RepID=A0A061RMV2_9CHLO|mmetsp:Transcript_33145/g.78615  ORF Transcript_33145/g.78615 Transcript_33145/m.78615 type:complete len:277 (+) Transcript_33145:1342-2172(+)
MRLGVRERLSRPQQGHSAAEPSAARPAASEGPPSGLLQLLAEAQRSLRGRFIARAALPVEPPPAALSGCPPAGLPAGSAVCCRGRQAASCRTAAAGSLIPPRSRAVVPSLHGVPLLGNGEQHDLIPACVPASSCASVPFVLMYSARQTLDASFTKRRSCNDVLGDRQQHSCHLPYFQEHHGESCSWDEKLGQIGSIQSVARSISAGMATLQCLVGFSSVQSLELNDLTTLIPPIFISSSSHGTLYNYPQHSPRSGFGPLALWMVAPLAYPRSRLQK